jgi:hypothetical protein
MLVGGNKRLGGLRGATEDQQGEREGAAPCGRL